MATANIVTSRTILAESFATKALQRTTALWWLMALLGQWAFFYYIAAFYGVSTFSGQFEHWNKLAVLGRTPYVANDAAGNLAYALHALGAGIIAFGGALQLLPQLRTRFPTLHHWNGRLFLLTVTGLALSGYYLVWIRGTSPSLYDAIATSLNGMLILAFAWLALRTARARDLAAHRRWALRLYLVANGQWFLRVGLFSYFMLGYVLGYQPRFGDPVLLFWTFGCYLAPLAVLEGYLRAKTGSALARSTMAVLMIGLTLLMVVGIIGFTLFSQRLIAGGPISFR